MKTKTLLIAAVMFFALSVCAYAQTAYTVSQETLDKVACCGLAEPTGNLAFTAVAESPNSVTGTIVLRYNLPIANISGGWIQVLAVDGSAIPLGTQPSLNIENDVLTGKGVIVIGVPAGYPYPHTIRLSGVRVNVSGSVCGTDTEVTAVASSTGNLLTIGETQAILLVRSTVQALRTPVVSLPINLDAADGSLTGTGTINISENFLTAFGVSGVFPDTTRSQQTMIRLKVSAIPAGMSIQFPATAGNWVTTNSNGTAAAGNVTLVTSALSQYVYYQMIAASNPATTDVFSVTPTILPVGPYPLAPATITVSAAMAPLTTGASATLFPQYVEGCETAPAILVLVSGAKSTVLLVPYASTEVGYDTALAVANTTIDPGTINMGGFLQAIPQTGKLTVYFFPKDGTTIAPFVSTSHPSVFGLDANGMLPAGRTFVALLSELLPSSVTEFGGYVFIVTDFTNAHGEYFVSNFDYFTHGALMIVVNDPAGSSAGRTAEQGLNN